MKQNLKRVLLNVPKTRLILVYCAKGKRAGIAKQVIQKLGYPVISLGSVHSFEDILITASGIRNVPQPNAMRTRIALFFKAHPYPSDKMVHQFAEDEDIDKHELEEHIYGVVTECLKHQNTKD